MGARERHQQDCCARGCGASFMADPGQHFCRRHQAIAVQQHDDLVKALKRESTSKNCDEHLRITMIYKLQSIIANNDDHVNDQIEMFSS